MKKNTRKFIIYLTLLLGGTSIETGVVWANESGGKSEAEISYTENTDATPPKLPTNPEEDVEIVSPIPVDPGTSGPLSVDYAPHVIFGEKEASSKDDIYYAKLAEVKKPDDSSIKEVPNFLQLTDNRGKSAGWRLTIKQNGQLRNGAYVLKGAEITLKNVSLASPSGGAEPTTVQSITLNPDSGEPAEVARSTEQTGKGTWIIKFGKELKESQKSIQVKVPGKTEKKQGNYTTSLTWELMDAPI
ncbi:WxL domain-containing protein [Enterococcus sp. DIV0212c]|uniref:WxL domain-containing protein n=1 Tax=Enterococcus sp. DIV0212c TaxID=2230867 RepID=UPI001A9C1154|nr:WxL domain-containing protein [Enterococcus sp. DIV0212c]MBO1353539.1 WxL domain-containing protein [Enterococcus sp. DIV0212c]